MCTVEMGSITYMVMYDPINILKYLQKVISTGKGSSLFDSRRKKYYENIGDSPIRVLE